jgi:fructose/tagatose bisphosphate aldolase
MIDLSEEPIEENIEICKGYLERMSKMGMTLEIELGITGGEEDGVTTLMLIVQIIHNLKKLHTHTKNFLK